MDSAALLLLALKASLALLVLGIGLQSTPRDATFLFNDRGLLARSFLSMNVIMPLFALWLAIVLDLHPAVKLALFALAISPVPPFLWGRVAKAGGHTSYMNGLLIADSIAAIVVIPVTLWLLGGLLDVPLHIPPVTLVKLLGAGVLLPVGAGMGISRFAPAFASRAARPVTLVATIVLVIAIVPILIKALPAMRSLIVNGTLAAIIALTIVGLAAGHFLGGPVLEDRTVLALATVSRHPAVAMAITGATFPNEKLASAAVLLTLIVSALASLPYASAAGRGRRSRA